jgi:5-methyltetrahydrofolate--homocysteine methyltransferase
MMGVSPEEMTKGLTDAGADVIGTNCGNGMAGMADIVGLIRSANRDIPVLVHANAGKPSIEDGRTVFPETPADMSKLTPDLVRAGASVIGGCCGTTPAHVRAIADAVRAGILERTGRKR